MFSTCNTAILVEPNSLQWLSYECSVNINPRGFKGATHVDKAYKGKRYDIGE